MVMSIIITTLPVRKQTRAHKRHVFPSSGRLGKVSCVSLQLSSLVLRDREKCVEQDCSQLDLVPICAFDAENMSRNWFLLWHSPKRSSAAREEPSFSNFKLLSDRDIACASPNFSGQEQYLV
ncbi:hypothetical protein PMIN02_009421 [Paraphaeosphaeria minitans]